MDPRNLYTLRYREGFGVQTGLLVASTPQLADAIGKKWCNSRINCRFIRTERTVLADESILGKDLENGEVVEPTATTGEANTTSKAALTAAASAAGGVPTAPKAKAS